MEAMGSSHYVHQVGQVVEQCTLLGEYFFPLSIWQATCKTAGCVRELAQAAALIEDSQNRNIESDLMVLQHLSKRDILIHVTSDSKFAKQCHVALLE